MTPTTGTGPAARVAPAQTRQRFRAAARPFGTLDMGGAS